MESVNKERKGKLHGTTRVIVPWVNQEGQREYTQFIIEGTIYASKVYAGIRQWVKDAFNIGVDKDWLINVPLIYNSNDPEFQKPTEEQLKQRIEDFIAFMESEVENQDEGHTESETEVDKEATEHMPTLRQEFNRASL